MESQSLISSIFSHPVINILDYKVSVKLSLFIASNTNEEMFPSRFTFWQSINSSRVSELNQKFYVDTV